MKERDDFGQGGQQRQAPAPSPPFKPKLRICVPVVEPTVNRARGRYQRAARKGLWTEIRLDYLEEPAPNLQKLFRTLPGPVIATNRPAAEGGRWQGSDTDRLKRLDEALALQVTCLDVELSTDASFRRDLAARRNQTKLILSWHDFSGTPDASRLEAVLAEMLAADADILKLVTMAKEPEDNLRLLSLIPRARAQAKEIIAFCMGPLGKWSRLAAPLLGSFLTFAPFAKSGASAPGQLTVNDLKKVWRTLR